MATPKPTLKYNRTPLDIDALIQALRDSPASDPDMARFIAMNAQVDWNRVAGYKPEQPPSKKDTRGPSVISRILDILARPNYAMAQMVKGATDDDPYDTLGENLWAGLSGKKKTLFSDVLGEAGVENPVGKYGGGFALDVLLDPTTYIGTGLIKSGIKGTKSVLGLGETAAKVTDAGADVAKIEPTILGTGKQQPLLDPAKSLVRQKMSEPLDTTNIKVANAILFGRQNLPAAFGGGNRIKEISALLKGNPLGREIVDDSVLGKSLQAGTGAGKIDIPYQNFGADTLDDLAGVNIELTPRQLRNAKRQAAKRGEETVFDEVPTGKRLPKKVTEATEPEIAYDKFRQTLTEQLRKGHNKKQPLVSSGAVNVDRAEDIISKIAKGENASLSVVGNAAKFVPKEASNFERFTAAEVTRKYADEIASKPNKYTTAANKAVGKAASTMNPAQQANLFERMKRAASDVLRETKGIKKPNAARFEAARFTIAHRMMREAEELLTQRGLAPTFWDGSNLKLTDVINELGGPAKVSREHMTQLMTAMRNNNPNLITAPEVKQAFEKLRAASAIKDAQWVKTAVESASKQAPVARQILSDSRYQKFIDDMMRSRANFLAYSASPAGMAAGKKLLNDIFVKSGSLPQAATQAQKVNIQRWVAGNNVKWNKVQSAQTKALERTLGISAPRAGSLVNATPDADTNKAIDFFMSRFASWWGQKDLRPEVLIESQTAQATASRRAMALNAIAKNFTPDEQVEAFKLAQGSALPASSARTQELSQVFARELENLFRASGVTDEAERTFRQFGSAQAAKKTAKGAKKKEEHLAKNGVDTTLASRNVELANTLALRAGLVMDDINKQLKTIKSNFQFTNKVYKNKVGQVTDYSNGTDWLKSWERANITDPLDFMYKIQLAAEQVTHKYAFMDEVAARWGKSTRGGEFTHKVNHPRLANTYFPSDIAQQFATAMRNWDQIYDPKSPLISYIDRVTRTWKSAVTIYAPSHHIRNFMGDTFNNFMAGVNNPNVYRTAGKILYSQKKRYKDLENIENLTGRNAISMALTRPGDVVLKTKSGHELTAEQVYIAAFNNGLLPEAHAIEELFGEPLIKAKPLGGRGQKIAQGISENREHYVRLAHFVDILKKSKETDIQKAFRDASKTVRKWHPDGMDLTDFERNAVRRLLPFYSWTRKTIPLVIEGAVTRPGKFTMYPKGMYALQGAMGIESETWADPFPVDQLFPSWIKAKGIGPIMGGAGDYGIVNPSNPSLDLISQFSKPKEGVASMVTPLLRIPAEVGTGHTTLGTPIDANPQKYAANQIPGLSPYYRMTGWSTKESGDVLNPAGIINFLTALGIQPTKPYIKSAEYELRGK